MRRLGRNCRRKAPRRAFTLLEVIAALVILGWSLTTIVALASACTQAVTTTDQRAAHEARASRLLATASIWPRADLDRRLGVHREGEFVLEIERSAPNLYALAVFDSATSHQAAPIVSTSTWRRIGE